MTRRLLLAALAGLVALSATAPLAEAKGGKGYGFVKKFGQGGETTEAAPNGDIYVERDGPVEVSDSQGAFLFGWTVTAAPNTQEADDIAIDPTGLVYTSYVGSGPGNVSKFTRTGAFIGTVPAAQGFHVQAIATDSSGNLYLATGLGSNDVVKLSPGGAVLAQWDIPGRSDEAAGYRIATDAAGFVYVADYDEPKIFKFTGSGSLVTSWGEKQTSTKPGNYLGYIQDIEVGPNGSIYVLQDSDEVVEFDSSGGRLGSFELPAAPGNSVDNMAVGPGGFIYLAGKDSTRMYRPQPGTPKVKKGTGKTRKRKMSIKFSGSGAVRFECKLTGARVPGKLKRWRGCRSPKRFAGLKLGAKVFQVRGVDAAGTRGEPATKKWVIVP